MLVANSQGSTFFTPEIVAAVNIAAGALITLIAGQPPTVTSGDTIKATPGDVIKVETPSGSPDTTVTV